MKSWLVTGSALLLLCSPILAKKKVLESATSEDSAVSEEAKLNRRLNGVYSREWGYYGMPIETKDARKYGLRLADSFPETSKVGTPKTSKVGAPKTSKVDFSKTTRAKPVEEIIPTKWNSAATTTNDSAKVTPSTLPDFRYRRLYNADETTTIEECPYMAAILMNKQLWCGAVILGADRLLTAAHCLQLQYNNRFFREYVKMLTVRVGSTNATAGGEVYPVTDIFFHPNYKPDTLQFNFAVIKINKNLTFSESIRKLEYSNSAIVPVDRKISFQGWGSVWGDGGGGGQVLLQKVVLPVYDLADCQDVYSKELVTKTNFCAGYITEQKNVCNHDAGGPAILDGRLVGILSFSNKRCDELDKPAVFSKVAVAYNWIESLKATKNLGLKFIG